MLRGRPGDPAWPPEAESVIVAPRTGAGPGYVRAVIGNRPYPMAPTGTDWKAGVQFTLRTMLPAGDHKVLFVTGGDEIAGQMIHVGRVAGSGGTSDGGVTPSPKPPTDPA